MIPLMSKILILTNSVLLTSCLMVNNPTETDAKKVFEEAWPGRPRTIRVLKFAKTNGVVSEINGVQNYRMNFESTIEYPNGNNTQCLGSGGGLNCLYSGTNPQPVGATETYTGEIVFEKTENGWVGSTSWTRWQDASGKKSLLR